MAEKNPSVALSFNATQFKKEINEVKNGLKETKKEFQLQDETLKSNGQKLDVLKNKLRDLTETQKTEVTILNKYKEALTTLNKIQTENIKKQEQAKKAYEDAKKSTSTTKEELAKLKAELDKANNAVDSTNKTLSTYQNKLLDSEISEKKLKNAITDTNNAIKKRDLEKASANVDKMNSGLDKAIGASVAVASAFATVGAGAVKLGLDSIKLADDLATEADQLGLTAEQLQKFKYLALQTDVEDSALSKFIVKLNGDIGNLAIGIEDNGNKALLALIKTVKNGDGSLKDSNQVFLEVVDGLGKIENQALRTGIANQIFGEKFAKDLNPLLNKSADEIKGYLSEFEQIGYLSNETVADMALLDEKINKTKQIFAQLGAEVGVSVTPFIEEFTDFISDNREEVGEWASVVMENIINTFETVYKLRGAIVALIAVFAILKVALTVVSSVLAFQKAMVGASGAAAVFNAVVAANPLGMLAIALGVVVGAIVLYNSTADESSKKQKQLNDDYQNAITAIDKKSNSEIVNAEKVNILKNKMYELDDQLRSGNLTTEEATKKKQQLKGVAEQLTNLIPNLKLAFDKETGALITQRGEVDNLAGSYVNLAIQKAKAAAYQAKIDETMKAIIEQEEVIGNNEYVDSMPNPYKGVTPFTNLWTETLPQLQQREDWVITKQNLANARKRKQDLEQKLNGYISDLQNNEFQGPPLPPPKKTTETGGGITSYDGDPEKGKSAEQLEKEAERAEKEAAQKAEEERKKKVEAYKKTISEIERLDLREQNFKKEYGELTAENEKQILEDRIKRNQKYADDVLTMEKLTAEERADLYKEYTEKVGDLNLDLYKLENENAKKSIEDKRKISNEWIDEQKFYGLMSEQEEYDAILRFKKRELEASNFDYVKELDRKLFTLKKTQIEELAQKELDEKMKLFEADRKAINDKYDLLNEKEDDLAREQEKATLTEQMALYKGSVTKEGKDRYLSLQKDYKAILLEEEKADRDKKRLEELKVLDEQEKKYTEDHKNALAMMTSASILTSETLIAVSQNLADSFSQIISNFKSKNNEMLSLGKGPISTSTFNQINNQTINSANSANLFSNLTYGKFKMGWGGY